jgi:hypothetical protein
MMETSGRDFFGRRGPNLHSIIIVPDLSFGRVPFPVL